MKLSWGRQWQDFQGGHIHQNSDTEPWTVTTTARGGHQTAWYGIKTQFLALRCVFDGVERSISGRLSWLAAHFGGSRGIF